MKNIVFVLFLLFILPSAKAEEIKFFLKWSVKTEDSVYRDRMELFCDHFSGQFHNKLIEYFPCATYATYESVAVAIDNERMKQLLGVGDDEALKTIGGAVGAQYLVSLKMIQLGQNVSMNAICMHMKSAKMLVNVLEQAPLNEDAFDVVNKMVDKFVDDLLKLEICPYKGDLKVEVTSELKVDESKQYPIYCNEQDKTYKLHYKETKNSVQNWVFKKETKVWAQSYIDYTISEESEKEIDDGCYTCPQGKTRRYYHETISKSGKIDDVSEDSELYGKKVSDARINITFNDNGTYTIKIEATSKESDITTTVYKYAESWCDNDNKPPQTIKNKVDIPLVYIFGPYPGTARDDFLKQHPDPVVVTNPVSGEKTTYDISFELLRE